MIQFCPKLVKQAADKHNALSLVGIADKQKCCILD